MECLCIWSVQGKELRENAEKRESDLKNKENDEKQEEKRNKHDAQVRAHAGAMEKHATTPPPKSAASEQGCRCNEKAEKTTQEETAATTKIEERSAPQPPLQRADALLDSSQGSLVPKDSEHSDDKPSAWIRRVLRRNERQKKQAKEKPHVPRESSVEDSSQRRHHRPQEHEDVNTKSKPLNIAMSIYNGVVTKSS